MSFPFEDSAVLPAAGGGPFQPLDADLTAIAALAGTGILCRTGANTWVLQPTGISGTEIGRAHV